METRHTDQDRPHIVLRASEHSRLTSLALAAPGRDLDVADDLQAELERASIVSDDQLPTTAVAMGSTVTYETESGQSRTVTLCYPGKADIERSMVSVLTPIGVALIGMAPGQAINWSGRDGQMHRLTIKSVE
ncbi:nucleoside diphosphate kinase regulator [Rhizobium sp. TRM96647]|uniref:nucleoside diphosphate kinase regulator n=1 Tax=unclassified Rhizobium TaxID=2613769 RepID=UPI0021E7C01A|nr:MULTISPECIES: nucleoside diphosphate kinase regulator [unclassified Rhizobium]MCV3736463.1 nucleoside diphosphate kinase regulator [Rhizobium sp. TRM96647]MCV3758832.1 nucleoside diphosphate kinase regulator [Rhizobium sp. TRM96650]